MAKILIVEDEKPMAKALELKLKSVGYEPTVVHDGAQAIAHLETQPCDLVLLDLMMPNVDGFVVLEEMKTKAIQVPTIVSTNLSQEQDKERVEALGAVDYFVKSNTSIGDVVEHVKKVLNSVDSES